MNSDIRRHHYKRLQKSRNKYWFGNHNPKENGMVVSTPHPCSCDGGCGNFRKMYGRTRQELRAGWPKR